MHPQVSKVSQINGTPYRCETTLHDPDLEEFILQAERFVHEYHTSLGLEDSGSRKIVRERIKAGFTEALMRSGKAFYAKGEQIEPMNMFAMNCLYYIGELGIDDPHTLGIGNVIASTARRLQVIAAQEIEFDVCNDPLLERMVLRSGRLIIPAQAEVVVYAYRDRSSGDGPSIALERVRGPWRTADEAVNAANARNTIESTIVAHAAAHHDIGRTILPLFTQRYPDLGAHVPTPGSDGINEPPNDA